MLFYLDSTATPSAADETRKASNATPSPELLAQREFWSRQHLGAYPECLGPPSQDTCDEKMEGCIQSVLNDPPPLPPLKGSTVGQWHLEGWEREHRCPIRIRVHWMSLEQVSTVTQSFRARLWIQLKWREELPRCLLNNAWAGVIDSDILKVKE